MAKRDLFDSPFDEGTMVKLKIFHDYFKSWLPVFISQNPFYRDIQIFDFFAGAGKDNNNIDGSPLRILKELNNNISQISISGVNIKVVLNEYDPKKFASLKENVERLPPYNIYQLEILNQDFRQVFDQSFDSMKHSVNFLFLDQNGIKQIDSEIFKKLITLEQTDFLFFISSSYIKRFGDQPEFRKYLDITRQQLDGKSYYHVHRIVLDYYRSLVPVGKDYFLAPFSIKKPGGIYGLIFGTSHKYGIEKFLDVCWKHDKVTGEANYNIDNERIHPQMPALFAEFNTPSKVRLFEINLWNKILSGELKTNLEVYKFAFSEGLLLKHANKVLSDLKQQNKVNFSFKLITTKLHKQVSSPINLL